jgi:hypothetical protein
MSTDNSSTEANGDCASLLQCHSYHVSSEESLSQWQLTQDGWRWAICSSVFPASAVSTSSKSSHEHLRLTCAFPESLDPNDCFSKFLSSNFLQHEVISSTNRAARKRQNKTCEAETWQDLDMNELMKWIGILELMQITETSSGCVQEYWKPNAFYFGTMSIQFNFSQHMSQHRWLQILNFLTFDCDISELFDAFNQRVEKTIAPGQALSICQLSQIDCSCSRSIDDWMCLCDMSTDLITRLPSSPSKSKHWSEQVRDSHTAILLGLTQPYHFSFRDVFVLSSKANADAVIQLHKRGINSILLSDNTLCTSPPFYPANILQVAMPPMNSCLICDRSFGGTNVRIIVKQFGSCAFCTNDAGGSIGCAQTSVSTSDLQEFSTKITKIAQFKRSVDEHTKSFMKPIRQAITDIQSFEKVNALVWMFALVEHNAKKLFDIIHSYADSPLLQFRARLANKILGGPTGEYVRQIQVDTSFIDHCESKKRRIAEAHRIVRLDNSAAQVQRQCSLACRCANKKSPSDSAPRTSNACSCAPSIPLCSKVCHAYHVLSQSEDIRSLFNANTCNNPNC